MQVAPETQVVAPAQPLELPFRLCVILYAKLAPGTYSTTTLSVQSRLRFHGSSAEAEQKTESNERHLDRGLREE